MKKNGPYLLFAICFLTIMGYIHIYDALPKRPQAIHIWAQADRACVARNYAQGDMDFFKPKVNFTKENDGLTGMEFPFMNYMAAICYRIFGFNEFWYRFLMFLVVSAGVFAAFAFSKSLIGNSALAICMVLLWFLSPTLDYYAPNFIPDAGSIGFILIAWLFYFRYSNNRKGFNLILFALFAALASLIKITSLISVITILIVSFAEWLNANKNHNLSLRRKSLLLISTCIIIIIPVILWYKYAEKLNNINNEGIFTLGFHPVKSFAEFKEISVFIYYTRLFGYYSKLFFMLLFILTAYILFYIKKADNKLLYITILLYLGDLIFLLLMYKQFQDHDYYVITLLVAPLFQLITAGKILAKNFTNRKHEIVVIIILAICVFYSARFSRGNYYYRYYVENNDKNWDYTRFYGMDNYLKEIGIKKDDKAIVIYDESFDISLYFMNLKGWTMWRGENETKSLDDAIKHKVKYIILRNPEFLQKHMDYQKYFNHLITNYNGIGVYSLTY